MAKFSIEIASSVEKDLRKIQIQDQKKILRKIKDLGDDPRPQGCKKLSGQERYRVRQGDYRILYEIKDERLIVMVVKVGNRRDVYR